MCIFLVFSKGTVCTVTSLLCPKFILKNNPFVPYKTNCVYDVRIEGGRGFGLEEDHSTDRLREWDSDKAEEVQKSQMLAEVISDVRIQYSIPVYETRVER